MSKVKTTIDEQINILKSRNVKFNIINEEKAKSFIENKTYYFKVSAYRENFDYNRLPNGEIEYKDLDFAYLVEMSKIDMYLRYTVLELTLDIEHYLKKWIVNNCTKDKYDDGYSMLDEFLNNNTVAINKIHNHSKSPYSKELINKYQNQMPIWVFAEVSTFGDFLFFYNHYCKEKRINAPVDSKILNQIKALRNACAHNNCIINKIDKRIPPTMNINAKVKEWCKVLLGNDKKTLINNMLKRQVINDFVSMLYVYTVLSSDKVIGKKIFRLYLFFRKRAIKHKHYFKKNQRLINAYTFVYMIINELKRRYYKGGIVGLIRYWAYI